MNEDEISESKYNDYFEEIQNAHTYGIVGYGTEFSGSVLEDIDNMRLSYKDFIVREVPEDYFEQYYYEGY